MPERAEDAATAERAQVVDDVERPGGRVQGCREASWTRVGVAGRSAPTRGSRLWTSR